MLAALEARDIAHIACLGDTVGYGPWPNECVALVSDRCDIVVMGNHDERAAGLGSIEAFSSHAREAMVWTRARLLEPTRSFLAGLPYREIRGAVVFAHSTPTHPETWDYIFDSEAARHHLRAGNARLAFIGHSHLPAIFSDVRGALPPRATAIDAASDRYVVNVGSVGQPRDGDPRACAVIWDGHAGTVEYLRVAYPVEETRRAITAAGLPAHLGDRLVDGR